MELEIVMRHTFNYNNLRSWSACCTEYTVASFISYIIASSVLSFFFIFLAAALHFSGLRRRWRKITIKWEKEEQSTQRDVCKQYIPSGVTHRDSRELLLYSSFRTPHLWFFLARDPQFPWFAFELICPLKSIFSMCACSWTLIIQLLVGVLTKLAQFLHGFLPRFLC